MQVKTIVLLNRDECDTMDSAQILMSKYMEQLERIGDTESELYQYTQKVFYDIDYFFDQYEKIDPDRI